MGNDGGSIPTRRELVRTAAREPTASELKQTQLEKLAHYWSTCALSNTPLAEPVVSDSAGNLYNKDAVLKVLLARAEGRDEDMKQEEEVLGGRVKGLKDLVEVKFKRADDGDGAEKKGGGVLGGVKDGDGVTPVATTRWVCPISEKRLGAGVRSVYLVPCGHVFSEEGLKMGGGGAPVLDEKNVEKVVEKSCLECNTPYTSTNIIPILPVKEEEKGHLLARRANLASQGLTHTLKKISGSSGGGKKRKNKTKEEDSANVTTTAATATVTSTTKPMPTSTSTPRTSSKPSTPTPVTTAATNIQNSSTASLTAKVLSEEQERTKRRKLLGAGSHSDNLKTLFTSSSAEGKKKGGGSDFMTRGYSIGGR